MTPRTVLLGYDPREHQAYLTAQHSILRHSPNVLVVPLYLPLIKRYINREIVRRDNQLWCPISEAPMSTEFAISRFASFHMTRDWAVFMDCDMVCYSDINELFDLADEKYAVMVVKHEMKGEPTTKMDGQMQTFYNRKNWSSLMLINGAHVSNFRLTKENLHRWAGRRLHAFEWLKDEEIGELPKEWNTLVGIDPIEECGKAKILHWTLGHPGIEGWKGGPLDSVWEMERSLCSAK